MAAITTGSAYVVPKAAWKVMLGSTDLTDTLAPRLISLRLTEKRGESADDLSITLHDADGALAVPPAGAVLTVSLGWERGTGVTVGLVAKGSFTVDEVTWEDPPAMVTINGRSADLIASFRTRKNRVWSGKTLGAIVTQIASDNGVTARCHPDLENTTVTSAEQANQSDMEFLRDLGRRYDAVATVKGGKLLFTPVNATTTATGATLPSVTITRSMCSRVRYSRSARDGAQTGAEAQYYDQDGAQRQTEQTGGTMRRRLKRVYASKADAGAAATSESNRLARAAGTLEVDLALGDATITTGSGASVSGFKSEVNALKWKLETVTHTVSGGGGFKSTLSMDVAT